MPTSILIIDDSKQRTQFITTEVLQPNGYNALVAPHWQDGLNLAITGQPALLLLGPGITTPEQIELLQALQKSSLSLPTLLIIDQEMASLSLQLLRLGVRDYILLPLNTADLLAAIECNLTELRLIQERDYLSECLKEANRHLDQRHKELTTLFGIGKSTTAVIDPNHLLRRFVEAAIYLTNAEESSILLIDEKTNELHVAATRGMDEHVARSLRLKVGDSLAGEVIKSGQAFVLNESDLTKIKTDYLVRSLMYVPLSIKGRVNGVLGVSNRQQAQNFTNHDLRLLSALSDYAAVFMENNQLAQRFEQEQNKLITIITEVEQPILIVDDNEQILATNPAFQRTFKAGQLSTQLSLRDLQTYPQLVDFIKTTPLLGNYHSDIRLDDGRIFSTGSAPISNVGRVIIMQETSHLKNLRQMKIDFITNVAHTLQAPLVSTREYAEMLQTAGLLTEKQAIFFDRMAGGLDKMIDLVNHLLDMSNIEADLDLNLAVIELSNLAEGIVADYQSMARQKGQHLVYHADARPAHVIGVYNRLKQVIQQLVDNAVNYTPEGGHISVVLQVNEEQVLFKVQDNGIGIHPNNLPFVFDNFFRSKDNAPFQTGSGLGLTITKTIIEKYGGSIWVESVYGQGSTFFFTLSLAIPNTSTLTGASLTETEPLLT